MKRVGNFVWAGDEYRKLVLAEASKRLTIAAEQTAQFIRDSYGESGVRGKRGGATKAERHANRSKPWQPPHVDTGHLKRSTGWDSVSDYTRRIGTGIGNKESVGYAMWLEFGTRLMQPRPFLRPGLFKMGPRIKKILMGKLPTWRLLT